MKQTKIVAAIIVTISTFIFGGCNTISSDNGEKEQPYTDTTGIVQEPLLAQMQQEKTPYRNQDTTINQTDEQGKKLGLWVEDNGLTEGYYFNGKKNGVFRFYYEQTGKLEALGWYIQDKPAGNWYYFDDVSRIFLSTLILEDNKKIKVKNSGGDFILLPFQCYAKLYFKNGLVAKEGIALYEDIEIDFYMYGKWKFYDETGKLIKEENYIEGKLAD